MRQRRIYRLPQASIPNEINARPEWKFNDPKVETTTPSVDVRWRTSRLLRKLTARLFYVRRCLLAFENEKLKARRKRSRIPGVRTRNRERVRPSGQLLARKQEAAAGAKRTRASEELDVDARKEYIFQRRSLDACTHLSRDSVRHAPRRVCVQERGEGGGRACR